VNHTSPNLSLQSVAQALGGVVHNGQVLAPGPGHSPKDRSLSVKLDPAAPDGFVVHSFAGDDDLKAKDYVRGKCGLGAFKPNGNHKAIDINPLASTRPVLDDATIAAALAAIKTIPQQPQGTIVKTYDYTDSDGTLLYQVCRLEPKNFRQRRPDGTGGWIWDAGERRVLYRLPVLMNFPDATVFVTEGEKDADRLAEQGHCATTVASGKWTEECVKALAGHDVLILEDNDEAGRKRARDAAEALHGTAKTIRIVQLPGLPEKGDVSDWLDADSHNADRLAQVCFATPLWQQSAAEKKPNTFIKLTYFEELAEVKPKPWLIKGVIARGETSSWIAPPGKGKSALLIDLSVHLANGKDWRGYRTKARCGVVYFAIERVDLAKRRLTAHKRRDNLPILPIAVAGQVIDLMDRNCANSIITAIEEAEQHFRCGVGLAVIDTYPKGIAAGGGDENQARDQNIVLANLRRVLDRLPIHIAGIGHPGKDETRGERGSNARLADVDVQVQISGDTIRTATIKKANDQPEGTLTSFCLEAFEFGLDEDGDPFRTFILKEEVLDSGGTVQQNLSNKQKLALGALIEVTLSYGQDAPREYDLPQGVKVVSAEQWKTELFRQNILDKDARNPRARYSELRNSLRTKFLIGVRDDWVWLSQREPRA
jgi:hypothetical protein